MTPAPAACIPGKHCERQARDLGACVAGYCNRPAPVAEARRAPPPLWAVFGAITFDVALDCAWGWCGMRRRAS